MILVTVNVSDRDIDVFDDDAETIDGDERRGVLERAKAIIDAELDQNRDHPEERQS